MGMRAHAKFQNWFSHQSCCMTVGCISSLTIGQVCKTKITVNDMSAFPLLLRTSELKVY